MTESDERLTRLIENDVYGQYNEWAKYLETPTGQLHVTVQDYDYGDGQSMRVELGGHGLFEISVSVKRLPGGNRWRECSECNTARHTCPGCGEDIEHGEYACRECSDHAARLDLERRLQVRKEMVAAGIPERFELKVHEAGGVNHFLAEMDQHFGLPGQGHCNECTDYTDDPSTWCDCRGDEGPCAGTCKRRAHHPMNCPGQDIPAVQLAEGDEIFSPATGQWHKVIEAGTHGTTTLIIDRNNGSTFQFKVRPEQTFKARRGPAGSAVDALGGEVIHSA